MFNDPPQTQKFDISLKSSSNDSSMLIDDDPKI